MHGPHRRPLLGQALTRVAPVVHDPGQPAGELTHDDVRNIIGAFRFPVQGQIPARTEEAEPGIGPDGSRASEPNQKYGPQPHVHRPGFRSPFGVSWLYTCSSGPMASSRLRSAEIPVSLPLRRSVVYGGWFYGLPGNGSGLSRVAKGSLAHSTRDTGGTMPASCFFFSSSAMSMS